MTSTLFLTAFDPTDLPGGSIDPMGFGSAFNGLADAFLPGLTGAAGEAAYFPVLCAGVYFADRAGKVADRAPTRRREERIAVVMRLERAWALGCVLASRSKVKTSQGEADSGASLPGLRGVTYATGEYEEIQRRRRTRVGTQYQLLGRQRPYGMVGLYGNVAARLGLIDQDDFALTAFIGEPIAEAFLDATAPSEEFRRRLSKLALDEAATVHLEELAAWGERCSVGLRLPDAVAPHFRDGLLCDERRTTALRLIEQSEGLRHPGASDLDVIEGVLGALKAGALSCEQAERQRTMTVLDAISVFERSYLWAMVGFERLLRLVRGAGDACAWEDLARDDIVECSRAELQQRVPALATAGHQLVDLGLHDEGGRVEAVWQFVRACAEAPTPRQYIEEILNRHRDVQHGKFDRGRRKLPWLEPRGATVAVTSSRAGGQAREVKQAGDIPQHTWRTYAARNLIRAVGGVS